MSTADLFEDGFPHGTHAGYLAGCKSGGACPAKVETGVSCAQANIRYAGDRHYARLVDRGATIDEQIAYLASDSSTPADSREHANIIPTFTVDNSHEPIDTDVDAEVDDQAETPAPTPKIIEDKHGTARGYWAGCRLKERCPGIKTVGKSCNQAVNDHIRDRKTKKPDGATPETATPAAIPDAPATESTAEAPAATPPFEPAAPPVESDPEETTETGDLEETRDVALLVELTTQKRLASDLRIEVTRASNARDVALEQLQDTQRLLDLEKAIASNYADALTTVNEAAQTAITEIGQAGSDAIDTLTTELNRTRIALVVTAALAAVAVLWGRKR
ncbi:hypothetical protein [Marisediminicola sp. LYQ134]|uniref:hypothetical protein n=1 Tax=Marisediminicola sp. LYQ134 TaxID=3391061 RepID=UPI0039831A78